MPSAVAASRGSGAKVGDGVEGFEAAPQLSSGSSSRWLQMPAVAQIHVPDGAGLDQLLHTPPAGTKPPIVAKPRFHRVEVPPDRGEEDRLSFGRDLPAEEDIPHCPARPGRLEPKSSRISPAAPPHSPLSPSPRTAAGSAHFLVYCVAQASPLRGSGSAARLAGAPTHHPASHKQRDPPRRQPRETSGGLQAHGAIARGPARRITATSRSISARITTTLDLDRPLGNGPYLVPDNPLIAG